MVNVLSEAKKQQVVALGRLGWSLRRIQKATGVRRETCSGYLKAAGIELRAARRRRLPPPALEPDSKPASEVITDLGLPVGAAEGTPERPGRVSVSLCAPHREAIELALGRSRNAMSIWQ